MNKGSENERNIAKFLTKWLTGKQKPYMFWRQDASGAIATIHIENCHMTGDICSVHPDSKWFTDIFSIEAKTGYPKTSFWQHFISSQFGIEDFWKQACDDAHKSNKHPMLIYRKKGRKQIVGIDKYVHKRLFKRLNELNYIMICWNKKTKLKECFLYDMEDFFNTIKPNYMKGVFDA